MPSDAAVLIRIWNKWENRCGEGLLLQPWMCIGLLIVGRALLLISGGHRVGRRWMTH